MHQKNQMRMLLSAVSLLSVSILLGCSTEKKGEQEDSASGQAVTPTASGSSATVQATGDTIVIEAWTDGVGNYFKPNKIEAHPGDVLRYVLKVGVHNVHFLPDSNEIKTGLPPASDMLQLPGQTYDLIVSMAPGKYYFQCDPHAALGMKGELRIEKQG